MPTTAETRIEAMRIARGMVKSKLREHQVKIYDVQASEITAASRELLKHHPRLYLIAYNRLRQRQTERAADQGLN